ncbi:hypothetical protein NECAME_11232 [Necator americanus]|uniref:Protein kinase domain-containing protein n=1 Tax=Necator americanus TaxID=51031 RepID=W2T7Q9_NECAM|nr:hypothetical protein NECAME_11232 [Necator americanus]ETN77201.1 hypothetical protein NECAME_11232 [Necator americanus]
MTILERSEVFELCEGGELLSRLRDANKPTFLVTTLLEYCLQIVKALTFLETKHIVHRDIAARNILLTKDEKNLKYQVSIAVSIASKAKACKNR